MSDTPELEDRSHRAASVRIQRRQIGEKEVDQVRVCISDLHLSCDITGDGVIRQAKRLAESHQAYFMYDEHNAERVCRVLGIAPGELVATQAKEQ